jgi:hypothetical protein
MKDLVRRMARDVIAIKQYPTRCRLEESGNAVEERALAQTVTTDETDHSAGTHLNAGLVQRHDASKSHANVACDE